ncbi:hypothetical protein K501DRAFT_169443 [Backusella circina FSU 941]|nr:hypothetical protein K501DRAFT_169443 [Backusella circina FSU 941]
MNIEQQQHKYKQQQQLVEEEENSRYIYYLAELSVYKLNNEKNRTTEPTLRKQVLIRNLLEVSSQQLLPSQEENDEENWLNACFEQLDEDMEENDAGRLVLAVPLNYNSSGKETVFLI